MVVAISSIPSASQQIEAIAFTADKAVFAFIVVESHYVSLLVSIVLVAGLSLEDNKNESLFQF